MIHSVSSVEEKILPLLQTASVINPVRVEIYNGLLELYSVVTQDDNSDIRFEIAVINNKLQISGDYGTYVFGEFSDPWSFFNKLSEDGIDPHVFLQFLQAEDVQGGSFTFDQTLATNQLFEYINEQVTEVINKEFSKYFNEKELRDVVYECQEYVCESVWESLLDSPVNSKREFLERVSDLDNQFRLEDILEEDLINHIIEDKFTLDFSKLDWLDADVISYHFVLNVIVLCWLAKKLM